MTTNSTITIADVEALADQLETDEAARRATSLRLLRACARIVAIRTPETFSREPVEYADVAGHSDNSFPSGQEYRDYSGPSVLEIATPTWNELATESGYYYRWRAVTCERGLFVGRDGSLWGVDVSGTGSFAPFAATPGDRDVEISLSFHRLDLADVSTDEILLAEKALRSLAFPLNAAKESAQ
jgi:hypothetical protein